MITAYIFLAGALVVVLFLFYLIAQLCFFLSEKKEFRLRGNLPEYPLQKERKLKKVRNKRRKNLLMHCVIQSYLLQGNLEKARELVPFLCDDALFGIQKRSVQL